ncbi:unnamed protein product [Auanema sp. JU1783]|nr:unnamed protein product [Auanema sp. JU1783]
MEMCYSLVTLTLFSLKGEKLGTIEEEVYGYTRLHSLDDAKEWEQLISSENSTPKKSATFHGLRDLQFYDSPCSSSQFGSDQQLKQSSTRLSRKRSLLCEMGSRIRLFSTGSFVSTAAHGDEATLTTSTSINRSIIHPPTIITSLVSSPSMVKTQSLNSFPETIVVCSSNSKKSHSKLLSRSSMSLDKRDISLNMEYARDSSPSQLGILCRHCSSTSDLTCPKAQQEMASPSVPSLYSLAASDLSSNEILCRICHCCWPSDPSESTSDPLISPCRCSGTLQYVHVSCLMHWLDISSRKLHRPAICELCLYKYRRRRILKYREIKFPECSESDIRYYTIFITAVFLMLLSALSTIICFQLDKKYVESAYMVNSTTTATSSAAVVAAAAASINSPEFVVTYEDRSNPKQILERSRDHSFLPSIHLENLYSTITLVSAVIFFISFFVAMYAHVKTGLSFCNYLMLCWSSNLDWSIEEYKQSRDSQYLSKLEELRRKMNEKQKKAPDEVEPLRSSVIVIE